LNGRQEDWRPFVRRGDEYGKLGHPRTAFCDAYGRPRERSLGSRPPALAPA